MKNILRILVCFLLMFMLVGCSTIIEPTKQEDTLLIGQLTLNAQGWDDFMGTSISGTLHGAITMKILNVDTRKEYNTSTSSDGFFSKINPESGTYEISFMAYQNNSAQAGSTIYWNPHLKLKYINVEPGKVINLGSLTWIARKGFPGSVIQDSSPESLKETFAEKFPKSLWNEREWVSVNLFTD